MHQSSVFSAVKAPSAPPLFAVGLLVVAVAACSGGSSTDADAGDNGKDGSTQPDADTTAPRTCASPDAASSTGTAILDDDTRGHATVTIADREACHRVYTLSSTAPLRDSQPANPRTIQEAVGVSTVRSGHDMFDALYALARDEVRELSVDAVRDGSFNNGSPVDCGTGGCFETGRLWNYVWTRDTAYAVDLGLSVVDSTRAQNSLSFKLSERRTGGDLQIVQDTGTGGSYPVSSDRVSWAVGAWALLQDLDGAARTAFGDRAYSALINTLEQDRTIVWDQADGLYRGEQSFLDWREQTYPAWTAGDVGHIGMSKALSTNLLHLRALEITAALADERDQATERDRYSGWADELRTAIRSRFWLETEGQFSSYVTTGLDPAPTRRYDLLGSAFAVLFGVATPTQADRILSGYPHIGPGAPVIWPQQQEVPIYHNRGEWPFVTAYWLRAAAAADHDAVADRMVWALMRGAALNLSNMENFEAVSGSPWVAEGATSGPVVNSQRQLWSVAGYLSMVHHTLFGLHPSKDGLVVSPYITRGTRNGMFAGTKSIVLNDYPYRNKTVTVIVNLPGTGGTGGSYRVERMTLNGTAHSGAVTTASLDATNRIEVWLTDDPASSGKTLTEAATDDWHNVFGPRTPSITSVTEVTGKVQLAIDLGGATPSDVSIHVYRDGVRVATGLPGSTATWTDPSADPGSTNSYCYAVELSFGSGNHSQHSAPNCWWQRSSAAVQVVTAAAFTNTGGQSSTSHGRLHYENWGDAGHKLVVTGVTASKTGPHLIQALFGNGAGGVTTGITCAVKRVSVVDDSSGAVAGEGALVMPHQGDWAVWRGSNFVPVTLTAGKTYTITVESAPAYSNMSVFSHFASYTGGLGGSGGEFNRVNIAELIILAR